VLRPEPDGVFELRIHGKSRMRVAFTYGSLRGAAGGTSSIPRGSLRESDAHQVVDSPAARQPEAIEIPPLNVPQ
jgi:hypothetical protein